MEAAAKRRKIRKGTHSCWECKRRKMKCIVDPLHIREGCNGCRKRGSKCIGQEFSETDASSGDAQGMLTPTSISGPDIATSTASSFPTNKSATLSQLSRVLYDALPSAAEILALCTSDDQNKAVLQHEILIIPYDQLAQEGIRLPASLPGERPSPEQHPVLIARYMLRLALFLQTEGEAPLAAGLGDRLAELAMRLVTTNDELLASLEGLECVMIESQYQMSNGNLRRSWIATRRAMAIAQLMGLHQGETEARQPTMLNPATTARNQPRLMWFRIVEMDCVLCLMLGLPPGSSTEDRESLAIEAQTDTGPSAAPEHPLSRLGRMHCAIASRLLDRNEAARRDCRKRRAHVSSTPEVSPHLAATLSIDADIHKALRCMPSRWWLLPNVQRNYASGDAQAIFWDIRRLLAQAYHFNLLNQVHLPYILGDPPSASSSPCAYSFMTCVAASREILTRFLALHSVVHPAASCRALHFMALMAALTLLLAHVHSYASCPLINGTESSSSALPIQTDARHSLVHQYPSDRAMVEQVQESMEDLNRHNLDTLNAKSAALLRQLLAIDLMPVDLDAERPEPRRICLQESTPAESSDSVSDVATSDADTTGDDTAVCVHIPYFGIIRIDRKGLSKRPLEVEINSAKESSDQFTTATSEVTNLGPDLANYDPLWPQSGDLGLVAGSQDWPFQGVDMAFFDSLTR